MKLEFRVEKTGYNGAYQHRVVISDMTMGGEPIYVSPPMMDVEAMELKDAMIVLYNKK